jgi:O-antigen ligase
MLAVVIPRYPSESLALLFGGIALRLSLLFTEYVPLLMVVAISSIVNEDDLPLVSVGFGSLHLTDILLLVLIGKVLYHRFVANDLRLPATPLTLPLLLWFVMVIFAAFYAALVQGLDFNLVTRELRSKVYYLLFLAVITLFRKEEQIRFLTKGMLAIGTFVALAMVAQAAVGQAFQLLPGRVEEAGTFDSGYATLRVLPPGHTLVYILFVMMLCRVILAPKKTMLYPTLLAILGAGVMLTYNRVYFVAIAIAMVALGLLVRGQELRRLALIGSLGVALLVTSLSAFTLMGGKYAEAAAAVTERFTSVFAGSKLVQSSSIEDRITENEYALQAIKKSPIIGSGLRSVYRPSIYGSRDDLEFYIHNAYLWFLKDTGIVGLLLFLSFFFGFVVRGLRNLNAIRDESLRCTLAGFTLSGLGMIPMALVNPVFTQWYSIICIGLLSGINEVIIALNATSDERALAGQPDAGLCRSQT